MSHHQDDIQSELPAPAANISRKSLHASVPSTHREIPSDNLPDLDDLMSLPQPFPTILKPEDSGSSQPAACSADISQRGPSKFQADRQAFIENQKVQHRR